MVRGAALLGVSPARLDPFHLPARYTVTDAPEHQAVYLDRTVAIIRRRLSGLPLTLRVPMRAFVGVQVRLEFKGETPTGHVELRHADPALTLPLGTFSDMAEAAVDWKSWARMLNVPMLLVESDGTARVIDVSALMSGPAKPRRMRSALKNRRPRFLTRRRMGVPAEQPVLDGREIIAYE
jgi:hypothetical protein